MTPEQALKLIKEQIIFANLKIKKDQANETR